MAILGLANSLIAVSASIYPKIVPEKMEKKVAPDSLILAIAGIALAIVGPFTAIAALFITAHATKIFPSCSKHWKSAMQVLAFATALQGIFLPLYLLPLTALNLSIVGYTLYKAHHYLLKPGSCTKEIDVAQIWKKSIEKVLEYIETTKWLYTPTT